MANSEQSTQMSPDPSVNPTVTTRKVTANLPEDVIRELTEVAKKRGITLTQALRRAIEIQGYIENTLEDGGTILVERKNKPIREIVFP